MIEKAQKEEMIIAANQNSKEREYWQQKLAGDLPSCRFLPDHYHVTTAEKQSHMTFEINGPLFQRISTLANGSELRLHMILTAGLAMLLHKYTGLHDILLGTPVLRQEREGDLINTVLVLRQEIAEQFSFKQILLSVKDTLTEAMMHQNYPLQGLLTQLRQPEGKVFPFDVALLLEDIQERIYLDPARPDLLFAFRAGKEAISAEVSYRTSLYEKETLQWITKHYIALLEAALQHPDRPLAELEMITEEEKALLEGFNQTTAHFHLDTTLHALFDQQVAKTPLRQAVADDQNSLTYAELKERAENVACALRAKGVGQNSIVALLQGRSVDMIVLILGILKAGAAYLPLNVHLPQNRLQMMLENANVRVLVAQTELLAGISLDGLLDLEICSYQQLSAKPAEKVALPAGQSSDLAYIIYTSGSTGKPKGTMIEHRSVINFVWGLIQAIYTTLPEALQLGLVSPFEFDASMQNMLCALLHGHTLHIVPEAARVDGELLLDFYRERRIEVADGTPTHLRLMLECISKYAGQLALKQVLIAGETLPLRLAERFLNAYGAHAPRLTNAYGPTETCVDSTYYHVDPEKLAHLSNLPIGRPMANQRVYIVDNSLRLQGMMVPGELCIAGKGLARGYLNQPELTAEKFVFNPFILATADGTPTRVYRTGDLARWLPDGNLEYIGRIDEQIKIHGLRIEPGEIEQKLISHPAIKGAVAIVREVPSASDTANGSDEKQLCAYIVADGQLASDDVRRYLAQELPYYMIPAVIVQLEHIPLMPNGKINRKALPALENKPKKGAGGLPHTPTETALAAIWRNVLRLEEVGRQQNFFELGGNSLQVISVASRIALVFQVDIPIREIFNSSTIEALAAYIDERNGDHTLALNVQNIERLGKQEYYQTSSAQRRLYLINKFGGIGTSYNIPGALLVSGKLDRHRFEDAVRQLLRRHESLRTSLAFVNGEPVQVIHDEGHLEIEYGVGTEADAEQRITQFIRPFNLEQAPLFRIGLLQIGEDRHLVLFDLHHIVADGVSLTILEQEFIDLYMGHSLPTPTLQYKDYANWQVHRLQEPIMQQQETFWLETFKDEIPLLALPTDFPRPARQSFEGDRVHSLLSSSLTSQLEEFAQRQGVTLYMLLLAAYTVQLYYYTQQEEIIVGSPISGRVRADLEQIVGMFVNTLAMRNHPAADKTFDQFLAEVKQNSLEAFQHQEYPFEELVDRLKLRRDLSRNPLFDTMLVMQNMARITERFDALTFTPYEFRHLASKMDITLEASMMEQSLYLSLEYATSLFRRETSERLLSHFTQVLQQVLTNPQIKLAEITLHPLSLTQIGPVDRKPVSPLAEPMDSPHTSVEPESALERALVEIWKQVLDIEHVGIEDDFFALGGHSLLAVTLDLALEEEGYPVDDLMVFEHRTVRSLARYLEELNNDETFES